ncbi:MAG: hypothetical protein ACRDGO_01960 [Actinomycetota bacterium]
MAAAVLLSVVLTGTAVVAEDRIRRDDGVSPTPSVASPTPTESPSPSVPVQLPEVDIASGPDSPTNQTTATFVFTISPADAVAECRLNGGDPTPCQSPHERGDPLEGDNLFEVRGIDAEGNAGGWADYRWTLDLTPPTVTFASVVLDHGNRGVECRVGEDGQVWNCEQTVTDLTGPQQFRTEYFSGSNSTTFIWGLDQTPARVSFSAGPAPAGEAAIEIAFDAGDFAEVCTVEAETLQTVPCGQPYRWPEETTDGTNVLEKLVVVATDAAGNVSEPAVFSWSFAAFSSVG